MIFFCLLQVYSPSPDEFGGDSNRYPSPKPGGPPNMYGEYPFPARSGGKKILTFILMFIRILK